MGTVSKQVRQLLEQQFEQEIIDIILIEKIDIILQEIDYEIEGFCETYSTTVFQDSFRQHHITAQTCYRIDAEIIKHKLKNARTYLNMNRLTSRKNRRTYLSIEQKHIGLYYCPLVLTLTAER